MMARIPVALTLFERVVLAGFGALLLTVPFTVGMQTKQVSQNTLVLDQLANRLAEQAAPRKQVPFNAANFDAFAGYYRITDQPERFVILSRIGDHFYYQGIGAPAVEIYPESETKFFTRSVPGGRQIQFNTNLFGQTA